MGDDKPAGIVILVILYVLSSLAALGLGALMLGGGAILGGLEGAVAGGLGAFGVIVGILGLLVAWGLWNLRSWARIVAIILAVLNLLSFPIGTILGIIILWYLFKQEIREAFH